MRNLVLILLLGVIASCQKQVIKPEPKLPTLENDYFEQPASRKPSIVLKYEIIGDQARLYWPKQGNQTSVVYKNGSVLTSCRCSELVVKLPTSGSDQYKVNGSNTVTLYPYVTPPTQPPTNPPTQSKSIRLDFDGGVLSGTGWNYFGDLVLAGSGLEQWQIDSIVKHVKANFAQFPVNIVTEGQADQVCYATDSHEWFGVQAGGVAFVNSFGTGDPCFAFSALLLDNWEYIAFVMTHEIGHTLGLMHTCEKYGSHNWMNYDYPEGFDKTFSDNISTVNVNNVCEMWNQILIINNTLK